MSINLIAEAYADTSHCYWQRSTSTRAYRYKINRMKSNKTKNKYYQYCFYNTYLLADQQLSLLMWNTYCMNGYVRVLLLPY